MNLTGYRLLAALCALLCALAPGQSRAATEWQSLLSEDFSQGEVSFYTGQASEAYYGIDDQNRYVIDGLNTEIDSLSALTKNLYYYYVESECELIDTRIGEMAFCGLVFHYNKKIPGKLAYYVFYIYADGYYGAKRVIGDNAEVILPLTRSEYIDVGRPNILAVDARGTRFDLYINGRYVDGFTDVRIDGGGFGFYVSQQSRAAFDNFEVKVERRGGGPAEVESPELLEGSSDDGGRSQVSRGENFGGYSFPNIPKDPNRPVYPWEVGVDKSETARKERAEESRERELADLAQKRLEQDLDPQKDQKQDEKQNEKQIEKEQPAKVEDTPVREEEPLKLDPPVKESEPVREKADTPSGVAPGGKQTEDGELQTHSFGDPKPGDPPPVQETQEPVKEDPPVEESKPVEEQAAPTKDEPAQDAEGVGGAQIPPLPAADGKQPDAAEEGGKEDSQAAPAKDESYTNVTLPGKQEPPAKQDGNQKQEEKQQPGEDKEQERSAEEIMREVRKGDDDWSTSAPPYRAPDPPKDGEKADEGKGSKEQDSQPKQEEKKDGESGNGELKGIELPPLDMARAPGKEASKQDEKQKENEKQEEKQVEEQAPAEEVKQEEPARSEPAREVPQDSAPAKDDGGGLSLFPDGGKGGDRPIADNPPRAEDVLNQPQGNPGELKLNNTQSANQASKEYDPFEGNPDVESVYDDFTEQRWPVADGDTSSYRYFGAAYEIDNTKSDTMAISYQQGAFSDARYGVDVEYLGGLDYVGYGLATRFSVKNGNVSYYGLFVSQSGEFLLLKVLDGKETVLRDWSSAPNLSRTLSNRIGMELIGNSIQCIVNGEVVATVTDDSLRSGGYALLCGPGTSTRFDNLTIKGLVTDGD